MGIIILLKQFRVNKEDARRKGWNEGRGMKVRYDMEDVKL